MCVCDRKHDTFAQKRGWGLEGALPRRVRGCPPGGMAEIKIPPSSAVLTHSIYLLSQGEMVVSPQSNILNQQFNQIYILRTMLAGREGDIGSEKSTFGTESSCLRGQF